MRIGIVIPTYEEQKNIKKIYNTFKKIKKINFFFCFVDGSYSNRTNIEIKKYFKKNCKIIYQKKKQRINLFNISSRCEASHLGFHWFVKNKKKINLIVDMDADLSSDPNDIYKAVKLFKSHNSDLIIGSKYLEGSKIKNRKFLRSTFSSIYTSVCRVLISRRITDFSAGFRFYKKKILKKMLKEKMVFKSPAQHLPNLLFYINHHYKISEFPANYVDTKRNSKSIAFSHIFIYILQLSYVILRNYFLNLKKYITT